MNVPESRCSIVAGVSELCQSFFPSLKIQCMLTPGPKRPAIHRSLRLRPMTYPMH